MNTIHVHQLKIKGFVALMGSIVISMVLLMIAAEAALLGWSTRFMVLTLESKETSVYLAHRCSAQAIHRLLQNPLYLGDETFSYGNGVCQVAPLSVDSESDPVVTVRVRVVSDDVVAHHEYVYQLVGIKTGESLPVTAMVVTTKPTVQLVSWREF
jgi:hypothetical protein